MPIRRLDPLARRPHRRGRSDRAAGRGGEGIDRERARRRGKKDRGRDRGRRAQAHPRRRRRARHGRSRSRALSVERHATSKIPDGDLMGIATFGFRGEALPSIASVSRLEIRTRMGGAPTALKIVVEDGIKSAIEPCAAPLGTRVEARDLFAATPARLKFLKSDRAEAIATSDIGQAAGDGRARGALFVHDRHRLGLRLAGLRRGRSGLRRAAAPGAGRRLRREFARARRGPRRRAASRPGRLADLSAVRTRASSSSSSTGARCATRRSPARCAGPTSISCPPTGMRSSPSSSNANRARSTSTCTRPRPRCAFATPGLVRGLVVGAIKQRLSEALHRAASTGGTATILAMRAAAGVPRRRPPAGTGAPRPRRRGSPSRRRRLRRTRRLRADAGRAGE